MMGPLDPIENQDLWKELKETDTLFPETEDDYESSDLIVRMNNQLEELNDLCCRLSFSLREIGQVLKVKA